jgi:HEAT repeat protein
MIRNLLNFLAILILASSVSVTSAEEDGGKNSLKYWVDHLDSADAEVRTTAAEVVFKVLHLQGYPWDTEKDGPRQQFLRIAKPTVPALIEALNSQHDEARAYAVVLLAAIGLDASAAQTKLFEIVRETGNPRELRFQAAIALANVSPIDKPAIPRLLEAFRPDAEDDIPLLIGPGLWPADDNEANGPLMDPDGVWVEFFSRSGREPVEVPALVKLVSINSQRNVRATAIAILGALGLEAKIALPKLRESLADDDRDIRKYAAAALIKIDREPTAIREIIKKLELSPETQIAFQESADKFFEQQAELADYNRQVFAVRQREVLQILRNRTPSQQRLAIRILCKLGPAAAIAIPDLKKAMNAPEPETRKAAKLALDAIGETANPQD